MLILDFFLSFFIPVLWSLHWSLLPHPLQTLKCRAPRVSACRNSQKSALIVIEHGAYREFLQRWKRKAMHVSACRIHKIQFYGCFTYNPIPRRWDSKWTSECKPKCSMVIPGLFLNGSFEQRTEFWPSMISICVSTSFSNLIFLRTGCSRADFRKYFQI